MLYTHTRFAADTLPRAGRPFPTTVSLSLWVPRDWGRLSLHVRNPSWAHHIVSTRMQKWNTNSRYLVVTLLLKHPKKPRCNSHSSTMYMWKQRKAGLEGMENGVDIKKMMKGNNKKRQNGTLDTEFLSTRSSPHEASSFPYSWVFRAVLVSFHKSPFVLQLIWIGFFSC